jgi:hypothetical protein
MLCLLTVSADLPPVPFSFQMSNNIKGFVEFGQKRKLLT